MPPRFLATPFALGLALVGAAAHAPMLPTTLIRAARVFDGERTLAGTRDVLVRGSRVVRVARRLAPRADVVIEAAGLTLLPALADLHIHTPRAAFESEAGYRDRYAAYLDRGIATVNEFSVPPERIAAVRGYAAAGPRVRLAARIGVPGGHGSETDWTEALTTTVSTPAEARAAVEAATALRPDMVKLFADGWRYGRSPDLPDMDGATMAAAVRAAHRAGLPVMSHTVTLAGLKRAARAGVDAVAHGVGDAPLDDAAIRLMRRHRTGYVPTLSAYEPLSTRVLTSTERDDLPIGARAAEERRLRLPVPEYEARRWATMLDNVRRVRAGGVRIGVGTDAGVAGVHAGWATLHELRLLVTAGLPPSEALRAATGDAARLMGDRRGGRVRAGARADLLLVGGRPDHGLDALYDVRGVWVAGVQRRGGAR